MMFSLVAIPLASNGRVEKRQTLLLVLNEEKYEDMVLFLFRFVELNLRVARKARAMLDALMGPDLS